jgi:hypothetical protein
MFKLLQMNINESEKPFTDRDKVIIPDNLFTKGQAPCSVNRMTPEQLAEANRKIEARLPKSFDITKENDFISTHTFS